MHGMIECWIYYFLVSDQLHIGLLSFTNRFKADDFDTTVYLRVL